MHNVKNNAFTTLASSCDSTDTIIQVVADVFPDTPFYISIDNEILEVIAKDGTNFTVVRGVDGSTAVSHYSGANVELRMVAGIITELQTYVQTCLDAININENSISAFFAYQSTAQSIVVNTWNKINFDVILYDNFNEYSAITNQFVPVESGIYLVGACVRYDATNTVSIFRNNSAYLRLRYNMPGTSAHFVPIKLNAGDVIDIRLYTTSSGSTINGETDTYFSVVRLW